MTDLTILRDKPRPSGGGGCQAGQLDKPVICTGDELRAIQAPQLAAESAADSEASGKF